MAGKNGKHRRVDLGRPKKASFSGFFSGEGVGLTSAECSVTNGAERRRIGVGLAGFDRISGKKWLLAVMLQREVRKKKLAATFYLPFPADIAAAKNRFYNRCKFSISGGNSAGNRHFTALLTVTSKSNNSGFSSGLEVSAVIFAGKIYFPALFDCESKSTNNGFSSGLEVSAVISAGKIYFPALVDCESNRPNNSGFFSGFIFLCKVSVAQYSMPLL